MALVRRNRPNAGGMFSAVLPRISYKVGQYLGKRTANYFKQSQSQSSQKRARVTSSGPITTQYDQSKRYQRKSMPKRRRKQWVRFSKRVRHVMLQLSPLTTFTNDNNRVVNSWVANTQTTWGVYLGGVGVTDNDEILGMFKAAYSAAITPSNVDDYKLFIKSMCLDVQLSNTGSAGCVVDVYELIARAGDNNAAETIGAMYNRLYLEMALAQIGTTSPGSPASTPFVNALFLQKWKILKKREILLGVGQVTTMQMRNPYNRIMQGKTVESNNSYIPGVTRAYLFQARGVPRNAAGTAELQAGEVTMCTQFSGTYAKPPGDVRTTASDQ